MCRRKNIWLFLLSYVSEGTSCSMKRTIALCNYPQYSAPGRAYMILWDSIACKCWQTHDMVNLIASWQCNYYQTTHTMVRYISKRNSPFLDAWIRLLQQKRIKRRCTSIVHMVSHDTFQSLFAELVHTVIIHKHRDFHPNDSLHE